MDTNAAKEIRPRRTLTKQESFVLSSLASRGITVFTVNDIRDILGENDESVRLLLHRLNQKGWARRIERGKYLLLPLEAGPGLQWAEHEYIVASLLVSPYYIAYASALQHYGYTDRVSDALYVATTKQKRPVIVDGIEYRFVKLAKRKFFGYTKIELLGHGVNMAEKEKAIVDGFDRPDLVGGILEPAKGLWFGREEIDMDKLVDYSVELGNGVASRRLGFWLEKLGLMKGTKLERLRGVGHSYAKLDPAGPKEGERDSKWRLIVNIPERQLLEWREH